MSEVLAPSEVRVLGSLIEKEATTPEYYPLSLNRLVNACNQKSNRDPVVDYDDEIVLAAIERLRALKLAFIITGSRVMLRVRRRTSGDIEMTVTDTGPGVPDTERVRVVQRFVRLENSRNEPGSGLSCS